MKKIKSILLIDDDHIVNYLNKKLLDGSGMVERVQVVVNGLEAMNYLQSLGSVNDFPEVILLDIKMPVMDGFAFLEEYARIRNIKKARTRIFILSTSSNPKDKERIMVHGIKDFIEKPLKSVVVKELLEEINSVHSTSV